jgi:hypothetical protein
MIWDVAAHVNADSETKQKTLFMLSFTTSDTSVSRIARYLEDHYAQQVWAPKKVERGGNGFEPTRSVPGQLGPSHANKGLDTIT